MRPFHNASLAEIAEELVRTALADHPDESTIVADLGVAP
jgi:hypothetical protein